MSSLIITDLLLPISPDLPAGQDMRADLSVNSLYLQMKDARQAVRMAERKLAQGADGNNVNTQWQVVYDLGIEILAKHSKDLEVASWLTEALLRLFSFAGLKAGFALLHALVQDFWEVLYPLEDEDGLITKVAPLTGLNGSETDGTLIVPIALVSLTEGKTVGPFALWQYKQVSELSKITDPDKLAQRIAGGAVTYEAIEIAVSETNSAFFKNCYADLQDCIHEYNALHKLLEQKCGIDAPPSSRINSQLNACLDFLKIFAKESLGLLSIQQTSKEKQDALSRSENNQISVQIMPITKKKSNKKSTAAIMTREEIFQQLLEAADYFRQAEPHSPLSYILERTVRWGRMPLSELLKELIDDEQMWNHLYNLTGISKQ